MRGSDSSDLTDYIKEIERWAFKYGGGGSPDMLMRAIVNGYQVESTPEDKLREYYERITDKERLEEIKEHFAYCIDEGLLFAEQEERLLDELYKKIEEQAKRVDELERKNYDLREDLAGRHSTVEELNEKINSLWIQNKRYRMSVEKIKRKIASNDERIIQLSTEPQFHDPRGRISTLNGQAHGLETALELLEDDSDE